MSRARTLARRCAVQALYQWQLSGNALSDIERQLLEEVAMTGALLRRFRAGEALTVAEEDLLQELLEQYGRPGPEGEPPSGAPQALKDLAEQCPKPEIHTAYFKEVLHAVPRHLDAIDGAIEEFSDRPVANIDPVERAILRIGAYELLFKPEIPYRVAVNEGIDLAKQFGAAQSHKYVNGLLDKIARRHRAAEVEQRAGR